MITQSQTDFDAGAQEITGLQNVKLAGGGYMISAGVDYRLRPGLYIETDWLHIFKNANGATIKPVGHPQQSSGLASPGVNLISTGLKYYF